MNNKKLFFLLSAALVVGKIQLYASNFSNYTCTPKEGFMCVGKCPGAKKPSPKKVTMEPKKSSLFESFDIEIDEHECAFDSTIGEFSLVKAAEPRKLYSFVIYSSNITAPIYNLPLQRSMVPSTKDHGFWFSIAPFIQPNVTTKPIYHTSFAMSDAGALLALGYNGSWWHIRGITSLSGNRTTYTDNDSRESISNDIHVQIGADNFLALGFHLGNENKWTLNCEGFVGFSSERHKKSIVPAFINVATLGTGAQASFDCTIAENARSKYEFSILSRFTYFVPKTLSFTDHKDNKKIGSGSYTPGSFLDLFIALKQYYGAQYQHSIDIGYNPTFQVTEKQVKSEILNSRNELQIFPWNTRDEDIQARRHTFYGIYGYNWVVKNMPMHVNFGSSITFGSKINSYATFFSTFGLTF